MSKLTHDEFVEKLKNQNLYLYETIDFIEEYKTKRNQIKVKCKLCDYNWSVLPQGLLRAKGCPKCVAKEVGKKMKKTHENFLKTLKEKSLSVYENIEFLKEYSDSTKKLKCKCKICSYVWEPLPNNLLRGNGCPNCGKNNKTHEQFIKEFKIKQPNLFNKINILGKYKNYITKIKCECKDCNYTWDATVNGLYRGNGCPKCAGKTTKTHEEFIEDFKTKQPKLSKKISIIGKYINTQHKILCECNICNSQWETFPGNLIDGFGCPTCNNVNKNKKPKVTHEIFLSKLKEKQPQTFETINILEQYMSAKEKLNCECKICGNVWKVNPNNLLSGKGCPICSRKKANAQTRKTHEDFLKDLKSKFPENFNKIKFLTKYESSTIKIKCKCKTCNHTWSVLPHSLMLGTGCPKCANTIKTRLKSHDEFLAQFKEKQPKLFKTIDIIGKYKGTGKKILCKCRICDNEWTPFASNLYRGQGCPNCKLINVAQNFIKTHEDFLKDFEKEQPELYANTEILEAYNGSKNSILCKCKNCNNIWRPYPNNLLRGHGCAHCASWKTERSFGELLTSLGIEYVAQKRFSDCKDANPLPFDYFITDYRFNPFLFEYQGEGHDRPINWAGRGSDFAEKHFQKYQIHDEIKRNYSFKTNIPLEEIWYYEEDKIEAFIELLRKHIKPEYNLDEILNTTREQVA